MNASSVAKSIIHNRQARHHYSIETTMEAGIVLEGSEVKSLRQGKITIQDAYVIERNGELYLSHSHIQEYVQANRLNHNPTRERKLLLHKREMEKLIGAITRKGYSLIPLSLYFNAKNRVKIEIALAKGKKLHDKRASEKEREWKRDKARLSKEMR